MTAEFSLLFVLAATILALPVVGQLRSLGAQIETLRQDLARAPQLRELRYSIRAVIVAPNTAEVVPFPPRKVPSVGIQGQLRKAA